jgi:hypothetical protein
MKYTFSGQFFTENSFLPFIEYFHQYFSNMRMLNETLKIDFNVGIKIFYRS